MKIIQIAAIENTHLKLLKNLNETSVRSGFEVHCISSKSTENNDVIKQGVKFHEVEINRKINPIKNIKSIFKLVKIIKKVNPDIVHVHTPVAAVLGRIAAKIAKVPKIIYTAHGFYFHDGMSKKKYTLFFYIEKFIGRYFTDYILTQSKEDFDIAVNNNFLKKKNNNNYYHISNGIDIDSQFNPLKIEEDNLNILKNNLKIKENDTVITFIGRLVEEKGILDFLDSYQKIKSKNIKYIVIGDVHESERDLATINKLNKYKNNKNIIFTGKVNNVNEYLSISDIFCLPSYREGMPRSIIEAMAMQNAVIATDIRGSREEVEDGKTGFLVPIKSSKFIANKIDELASNNNLLNYFKVNGYKKAKKYYNEKIVVDKQLAIFNKK
ncbi:glycosyltransferase family 4 protein [Staphylococcus saprophyticus]|uniref:glycosyltransferase family 4 protein n=1 Tax=Staphylococcus saprophyticus TaxID=29385 RepID=UPI00101134CB|nr:glycosyltransferase family 4 protein [Staphylococcus saprophyticus]RXS20213.1 glycosyltransferase family 1 protein [Staphylococcus saprophyticus]